MALILFLLALILIGLASASGRTPDTRDVDYSVGALLDRHAHRRH